MALEEKTARGGRERAAMVLKFKGFGVSSLSRSIKSPSCSYNFNIEKKERRGHLWTESKKKRRMCRYAKRVEFIFTLKRKNGGKGRTSYTLR